MTPLSEAAEQYIAELLEHAPPPPPEAVALFARTFGPTTTDTPVSDAAA